MSEINDLFVKASRNKVRFQSVRGLISSEDLWDLPLTAKNGFSLDAVARAVNAELKEEGEESFVETATNPRKRELELMLEIAKFIIATKKAESEKRQNEAARAAERQEILAALAEKKTEALKGASVEELEQRLASLHG